MSEATVDTPLGTLILRERDGCLCEVEIAVPGAPVSFVPPGESWVLRLAIVELQEYFAGTRRQFSLPLQLPKSSPFRRRVLTALQAVPYGSTLSYGELAIRAGSCGASRAVGQVMATNPLPIVLPCHRVLAAGSRLGGYSGGGGLSTKKWLLDFEGIRAS